MRADVTHSVDIHPATAAVLSIQKQAQDVLALKRQEITNISHLLTKASYTTFLADVDHGGRLVDKEKSSYTFSAPLFEASDTTKDLLARQQSPTKLYMDTNATLVHRYLNTMETASPDQLGVSKDEYTATHTYLQNLDAKITDVYHSI